jgi:hypothetical protein
MRQRPFDASVLTCKTRVKCLHSFQEGFHEGFPARLKGLRRL